MLWFIAQNPIPAAWAWPLPVVPAIAVAVAVVPVAVVAYQFVARHLAYRPTLRVLEGGRRELTLKPA